jgi:hypothetical protein
MANSLDALTPKQRAIVKQLGDLEVSLENGMAGALPKVFATLSRDVQRVAMNLSLDPKDRARTLRELIGLKRKMGDLVVNNPEYQREVLKLTNEFKNIKNLTDQFIGSTMDDFVPTRKLYDAILQSNIAITKDALLGGGIVDNFGNAIQEVLKANIAGVSDRAMLMETLRKFIEGTPERKAYLENYIKQTTNDSLMVFNREYLQTISEDLGMKHYFYQGTIINDTRQFCQSRAGKAFTKAEVEKWASLDWVGKMAGTNSTTIFSYAGGYNCRHKLWPITEEQFNRIRGIVPAETEPPIPVETPPGIPPQMTAPPVLPRTPKVAKTPKEPGAFYGDVSGLPNTIKGLKQHLNDALNKNLGLTFKDTIVARDLSVENLQQKVGAIERLSKMYRTDGATYSESKLIFKEGKTYYGRVSSGKIGAKRVFMEANFGSAIDPLRIVSNLSKTRIQIPKSIVDDVNEKIATSVHEYAHFITQSRANISSSSGFWDEMKQLFSEYKIGIGSDVSQLNQTRLELGATSDKFLKIEKSFRKNYLGDYSQTNVDEFFAEGFANFHLNSEPSKWALEIGKLANKYFKK